MTIEAPGREIVRKADKLDTIVGYLTFGRYGIEERVRFGLGVDLEDEFLAEIARMGIQTKEVTRTIKMAHQVRVLQRSFVKRR